MNPYDDDLPYHPPTGQPEDRKVKFPVKKRAVHTEMSAEQASELMDLMDAPATTVPNFMSNEYQRTLIEKYLAVSSPVAQLTNNSSHNTNTAALGQYSNVQNAGMKWIDEPPDFGYAPAQLAEIRAQLEIELNQEPLIDGGKPAIVISKAFAEKLLDLVKTDLGAGPGSSFKVGRSLSQKEYELLLRDVLNEYDDVEAAYKQGMNPYARYAKWIPRNLQPRPGSTGSGRPRGMQIIITLKRLGLLP